MKIFFIFWGYVYGLKWSNNQYDGYEQRAYSNYEGMLRKIVFICVCNNFCFILLVFVIFKKDQYESVSNYDDNRYDSDRGRARTSDRIANIPPSKNPTILLERILRNYDSKIRPNDKEIFTLLLVLPLGCPDL